MALTKKNFGIHQVPPCSAVDSFAAHSYMHIPRDECELLYRQVAATRATQAVEVGMALGISTLCLCDALCRNTSLETGNVRIYWNEGVKKK